LLPSSVAVSTVSFVRMLIFMARLGCALTARSTRPDRSDGLFSTT
jgi:hypothetical protein